MKIICEDSLIFWNNFSSNVTQCVYAISSSRDECWIKNWENSSQERRIANLTFNKPKSNCVSSTIVSYPKAVCIARKKQKQCINCLIFEHIVCSMHLRDALHCFKTLHKCTVHHYQGPIYYIVCRLT